jgi:DNA-3-methyladenine glycosylase II
MIAGKRSARNVKPVLVLRPKTAAPIRSKLAFEKALNALSALDPVMERLVAVAGRPKLRQRLADFPGLASIIVSQQLSTASAGAIFGRLAAALEGPTPTALVKSDDALLRQCGLSAGKIATLRACAAAIAAGTLDFDVLRSGDAESAAAVLTSIKGIGPWTADVFLLFCLGHADAWPAGDLALQEAVRLALDLSARPDAKTMSVHAARWRPWRGIAAHVLWAYYGHIKQRNVAPDNAFTVGASK